MSSHSIQSTAPSDETLSEPETSVDESPQPQREARVVHFNEQTNVLHDNTTMCREDVAKLWYSRFEFIRFRRETMQEAQAVVSAERKLPESENTSAALLKSYQNFCNVQTSADLLVALAANPQFLIPIRFIGLDRWTINFLLQDKVERRQRILRQIQWIQRNYPYDAALRETKIRLVSRTISQPSRLYAHHVAKLAARSS